MLTRIPAADDHHNDNQGNTRVIFMFVHDFYECVYMYTCSLSLYSIAIH